MATIELSSIAQGLGGFVINGNSAGYRSGGTLATAGDVNGDGLADLIVGTRLPAGTSDPGGGLSFVVFGTTATGGVDLSSIDAGSGGLVIRGQSPDDRSGWSVAPAGDINGDGLGDLLVGAPYSDPQGGSDAGRGYVVFGRSSGGVVELSAIAGGSGGFVVNGQSAGDAAGSAVAEAGDVNGDGLADLIIGAAAASPGGHAGAGRSYVVFGRTGSSAIDLASIAAGSGGFVVNGQSAGDASGYCVSGAGDVNGDGLGDLIIGALGSDPDGRSGAGATYVVFGTTSGSPVELSAIASGGGLVIKGASAGDQSGNSVSGVGDVNGDGLADLIVGASLSDPAGRTDAGSAYVVFGRAGSAVIELSAVAAGSGGFVINGASAGDHGGTSVAAAGDVNGDGLADLLVGAPYGDPTGGNDAGRSYVVFGRAATTPVELSSIASGTAGFVVAGQAATDLSGASVAAAGDINGDGLADLLVGAPLGDPGSRADAGRSYVILGTTASSVVPSAVDQFGSNRGDTLTGSTGSETLVGQGGNDTLVGKGGADVLLGGYGNDRLVLDAGNVAALLQGPSNGQVARADGGSGIDTLALAGTDISLNLALIPNQGAGSSAIQSRIESIERIDLTGSGNNTLVLSVRDVLDMSAMNQFNNARGWRDGTYNLAAGGTDGASPEQRHQLVVAGNEGDVVDLTDRAAWIKAGTVNNAGRTYTVYNHESAAAQVLIDNAVAVRKAHFHSGGHTYEIVDSAKPWLAASQYAQSQGAHLAIVSSTEENAGLLASIRQLQPLGSVPRAADGGGAAYLWLGATDRAVEGTWRWVDGAPVAYANWGHGSSVTEPDDYQGRQDGLAMGLEPWPRPSGGIGNAGQWNDLDLTDRLYSVIEWDFLRGTASSEEIHGTSQGDRIYGLAGGDTLFGGLGSDTVDGGAGDDDLSGDEGADQLLGGSGNDWLVGGDDADRLEGNAGNDVLVGSAGADTLAGGSGDDLYGVNLVRVGTGDSAVASLEDTVVERAGEGFDRLFVIAETDLGLTVPTTLTLPAGFDGWDARYSGSNKLNLTGNAASNWLIGNRAANVLDGAGGIDGLAGGPGDDTYVVDHPRELVVENAGEGTDLVRSSVSFALPGEVENLTLTGSLAINATGNGLANVLTGNGAANRLDGGAGADRMLGLAGNDTYVVDNPADVVVENASEGIDLVRSSISFTLPDHVEKLTLTGPGASAGTGNSLANVLVGNAAANRLDGGAGDDTMTGGAGNDTYVVDAPGDRIVELGGSGVDSVESVISYALGQHLENLLLAGANPLNGSGNSLANSLTGNGAANLLDGGGGSDTLNGGAGDDVLNGGNGNDLLTGGAGNDIFRFDTPLNRLANIDTISDFSVPEDGFQLENAVFAALAPGSLPAGSFLSGPGVRTAADADDRLLYDTTTGALYYDPDGSGSRVAVQFAVLAEDAPSHRPALSELDFLVT